MRRAHARLAVRRARREGLLRNAAVAPGQLWSEEAAPPLLEALSDSEPLVRWHAAWALGAMPSLHSVQALRVAPLPKIFQQWIATHRRPTGSTANV
jgi:epoxyqueuosine reductase